MPKCQSRLGFKELGGSSSCCLLVWPRIPAFPKMPRAQSEIIRITDPAQHLSLSLPHHLATSAQEFSDWPWNDELKVATQISLGTFTSPNQQRKWPKGQCLLYLIKNQELQLWNSTPGRSTLGKFRMEAQIREVYSSWFGLRSFLSNAGCSSSTPKHLVFSHGASQLFQRQWPQFAVGWHDPSTRKQGTKGRWSVMLAGFASIACNLHRQASGCSNFSRKKVLESLEISYSGHLSQRFQPKHQSTHQLSSRQYLQAPRVHCLPGLGSQKCRQGRIPPFWFVHIAVRHCCPRASRGQTWLVLQIQCKIQLHNACKYRYYSRISDSRDKQCKSSAVQSTKESLLLGKSQAQFNLNEAGGRKRKRGTRNVQKRQRLEQEGCHKKGSSNEKKWANKNSAALIAASSHRILLPHTLGG